MRIQSEHEYEDLLGQWADLESGLGVILSNSAHAQEFVQRITQYDHWMQGLMQHDPDVGLYLLFQLAGNSPVGYSASHALVCATLCHLLASELLLDTKERNSLVRAALTMNIAMTTLQDKLATQVEKPDAQQQADIRAHPVRGSMLLTSLGIADDLWLEVISSHHDDAVDKHELHKVPPATRLARILKMVDRYAAMISPRLSRAGRSATESARALMANASAKSDEIGHALLRVVGLYPPGTFVRLDNDELAVVVHRSASANQPYIAVLGSAAGELLAAPRLHNTAHAAPHIRTALAASSVRARLNHFHILRLSAAAGQEQTSA